MVTMRSGSTASKVSESRERILVASEKCGMPRKCFSSMEPRSSKDVFLLLLRPQPILHRLSRHLHLLCYLLLLLQVQSVLKVLQLQQEAARGLTAVVRSLDYYCFYLQFKAPPTPPNYQPPDCLLNSSSNERKFLLFFFHHFLVVVLLKTGGNFRYLQDKRFFLFVYIKFCVYTSVFLS